MRSAVSVMRKRARIKPKPRKRDERDESSAQKGRRPRAEASLQGETPQDGKAPPQPESEGKDDALEKRMKAIALQVIQDYWHNAPTIQTAQQGDEELPPEPATLKGAWKGRKENRRYERITITLDETLARLFTKEAKKRGLSEGKLMDAILWNRYGRPKLSYEEKASVTEA